MAIRIIPNLKASEAPPPQTNRLLAALEKKPHFVRRLGPPPRYNT
jgi:hypothetical protein